MKKIDFIAIVKKHFSYLKQDYGFALVKSQKEDWGIEVSFINDTTGIKITYEYRESYIFIMLYKLVDGKMLEDSREINDDTILNSFGLDDIVNLRNSSSLILPTYKYPDNSEFHDKKEGLSNYLLAFANNLKQYASDVLQGDFKIFETIDKIVKERAKKYKS